METALCPVISFISVNLSQDIRRITIKNTKLTRCAFRNKLKKRLFN